MSQEQEPRQYRRPKDVFGLTEHELLWDRLSDARFQSLLEDEKTDVHEVQVDTNSYGEFLFVKLSRLVEGQRYGIGCFSLGYHEYREQWITTQWYWYESSPTLLAKQPIVAKAEALELIKARRDEIAPHVTNAKPSQRGVIFSILPNLTDEDGAMVEIEDLGDDLLDGDF